MSNKKMGRPKIENPKNLRLNLRLDQETVDMLEECCEILGKTKADIFRFSIKKLYEEIKK